MPLLLFSFFKLNQDSGLWGSAPQRRAVSARWGQFVAYAWEDARNGNWDIYLSLFKGDSLIKGDFRANPDSSLGDQVEPCLAWSQDGVLAVVWEDRSFQFPKIRFALYDTTGRLMYRGFFADASLEDESQTSPVATWAGGYLFIAWESYYLGMRQIRARRFLSNGAPYGESVVLSGDTSTQAVQPAIAGNNAYVMTAWRTFTGRSWDIVYLLTSLDLESYSPPIPVLQDGEQENPALASVDSGFVLLWLWGGQVWGKPFNRFGSSAGPARGIVDLGETPADFMATGLGDTVYASCVLGDSLILLKLDWFLTVFGPQRVDDSPAGVLYGAALPQPVWTDARRGEPDVYLPGGLALNREEPAQLGPTVACVGEECLGFWVDTRDAQPTIYARAFSGSEFVLHPSGLRQAYPVAEPWGDSVLVLWQEETSGVYQILWAKLSTSGGSSGPQVLSPSAGDQVHPSLSVRDTLWAAAWEELDGSWRVRARLSNGVLLDLGEGEWPKVALGDSALLVVWVSGGELLVRGFSFDGSPAFGPLVLSEVPDASEPAARAFVGGFAVAWVERGRLKLKFLSAQGDTSETLEPAPWDGNQWNPRLSVSGDTLLVAWVGWIGYPGIFGKGYGPDGQPYGGFWGLVDSCWMPVWSPDVQAEPSGVAAVWVDYREGKGADVYGGWLEWNLVEVAEGRNASPLKLLGSVVSGELRLLSSRSGLAKIYDAAGRLRREFKVSPGLNRLSLSGFAPGLYVLRIGPAKAKFIVR